MNERNIYGYKRLNAHLYCFVLHCISKVKAPKKTTTTNFNENFEIVNIFIVP